MEFLKSCYQWVAENYNKIMMVLQSTQFASLVAGAVFLWKTIVSTRESIASSKKLDETVSKNNQMSENVVHIKRENEALKTQNEMLKSMVQNFETKFDEFVGKMNGRLESEQAVLTKKLNAVIDVQSIVYSTIRDDNTRTAINSILTNAKFDETADETRQKLMQEVSDLKSKLAEEMEKVKTMTEEASTKLEEIVEPKVEQTETDSVLSNFTRY
jgi:FtsZ-binding cell division protein ZapB